MLRGETGVIERSQLERDREVSALFNRYYAPMCRLAYVILGDAAVAEEVVMDALLKTYSAWHRIRDYDRVDAYLRRAVVNLCRSRIRRKAVESRADAIMRRREETRRPEWDPDAHDTKRMVWEAVMTLPERQRACVVLRYFEDLSEAQIAETLDCSQGTVKSQLFKARSKLEAILGGTFSGAS